MFNAEQFYDEYVGKVYKYFYVHCLDRHSAEDLTSQTFVYFLDKIEEGNIDDHKKYLYAIMRNVWADFLRLRYKQAFESLDNMEDIDTHVHSPPENGPKSVTVMVTDVSENASKRVAEVATTSTAIGADDDTMLSVPALKPLMTPSDNGCVCAGVLRISVPPLTHTPAVAWMRPMLLPLLVTVMVDTVPGP